jgi:hypothetical protein
MARFFRFENVPLPAIDDAGSKGEMGRSLPGKSMRTQARLNVCSMDEFRLQPIIRLRISSSLLEHRTV